MVDGFPEISSFLLMGTIHPTENTKSNGKYFILTPFNYIISQACNYCKNIRPNLIHMASIPAKTANTDTVSDLAALTAADEASFIAMVDAQILLAIAQGRYQVSATTFGYVKPKDIFKYYANLGYHIYFPDMIQGPFGYQPANLFGEFWDFFWGSSFTPRLPKGPVRIIIQWYGV
jgi:hypothetical protein